MAAGTEYRNVASAICDLFGLDPNKVNMLTLRFEAGDVAHLTAQLWADVDDMRGLVTVLRQYRVIPVEDSDGEV